MLIDKLTNFFSDQAYNGTLSGEIDLNSAVANQGKHIDIFLQGVGVAITGSATLTITSRTTSGSGGTSVQTNIITAAQLNAGIRITLPSNCGRYCYIAMTGTLTAGTDLNANLVYDAPMNNYTIA